jgi:L-ascorbate metabolism protein UlaG (beta-lactamase superfamily)
MTRLSTALAAVLACAAAAHAADKQVTIIWHGQSFFEIVSSAGTRAVLDPHAIEAYGRISVKGDIILMSHAHSDHTEVTVVDNYKTLKKINAVDDPKNDGSRQAWNLVDDKIKDVHYKSLEAWHDNSKGMERGKNGIWVLEVDGLRIVHLGDLGQHELSEKQLKEIGEVDVLMIPVGGVYTLNGKDATKVVAQLKPKRWIIPMHYGTKVFDDLLPPDEFLDGFKSTLIKKFDTNELSIYPADDPPKEPLVAVLNWQNKK